MKKLMLIASICIGMGFATVRAQDYSKQTERENVEDSLATSTKQAKNQDMTAEDTLENSEDRSKAERAMNRTGDAVKSGAKWSAKELKSAGKWTGKQIGAGATWSWNKLKHNKLTKNIFNQSGGS